MDLVQGIRARVHASGDAIAFPLLVVALVCLSCFGLEQREERRENT